MSGSSGFFWARAAAGAGLMSRRQLASDAVENVRFRLSGSTDESTEKIKARLGVMIAGKPRKDFARLGPTVLAGVLPRLYPQMLQLAWEHQDAGRKVFIATASTQDSAEMVAHVLGFDGAIGSKLEVDAQDRYTGRFDGPMAYREGKAARIREVADELGIDLAASYAYSDSESDLPMLRVVGHPVAVNPDAPLLQVAREEGWDVLRFEQLGGRLKMLAALLAAGLLGAGGVSVRGRVGAAAAASAPRSRRSLLR